MIDNFKYKLFFDLSPDLLCIAGYDGYFKKINGAVSKLFGYSEEELYARPINDFVYKDDQDITSKVRSELTKKRPLFNFENRYLTKQGEIVWLSWTSHPVDNDQLIFAIAKDITYKKKLEEERNSRLANLIKVNHDLKHITYITAHDLRSPVNNLLSVFDLLDISKIQDQDTLELIEILKLSGEKLKHALNHYVDALSEKDKSHSKTDEISLNESLSEVLQSISSLIQLSKATIHINFSELEKIKFNRVYLNSLFLNLITNSIKYAQPDCSPVITIHSKIVDGRKQLIIVDNGLGFNMEKVKGKIFNLHQKFHNNADSKGIGLYLVHNHITSMGGDIKLESKVNEGTKFTITFRD